jgi:ATP-dependent helicase/nuclease subunit B
MSISAVAASPDTALDALSAAIRHAQGGSRLEPVTVAVPTNTCGVMTRRALGRSVGIAGVDMVTLNRLAELVGGPVLAAAGRSPMSTPVIDLAVAGVLRDDPGPFRRVASHPSTVVALRDAHQALRLAGPEATERLARHSSRGRHVARVSTQVTAMLEHAWYDEADIFTEASHQIRAAAPAGLRHLVLYLPDDLGGLPLDFVRAMGEQFHVEVIAQLTGTPAADTDPRAVLRALGVDASPRTDPVSPQPHAVVSTTDADDEVRVAVRLVVDAARRGVPFERIAVFWPTHRPYARLVEHHLTAAGIRWNGRPGTSVSERLAPRLVIDLLDVDRRGLRRQHLFDLLADVPARDASGAYLPTAEWERVSRHAGVARDDDWSRRLGTLADTARWSESARSLDRFVTGLRTDLGHPSATRRWWDWAQWCSEQLESWIGRGTLDRLPESEYRAWESLTRALDRLRHLDAIGAPVTRYDFRSTLVAELDAAPGREGRVGDGVSVGPLAGAVGVDVDVAIVLGAAEGSLPPAPRPDPLLSEGDLVAAGLPTADAQTSRLHHRLLAVMATSQVTLTLPRGDLRATSRVEPSRWISPWVAPPTTATLRTVASHHAGLAETPFPASPAEHRLRTRYSHVLAGQPLADAAAHDQVLQRGLDLRAGRASDRLTAYDGDLYDVAVPRLDVTVSPSRLETWPACPHAYFVRYLLGVRPVEEPGAEISITALDRGSAHHAALDRFHRAVIDGELPQPARHGWSEVHRNALGRFFDDVCAATERRGRTGRPAFWADERSRMRADLLTWLDHDSAVVAQRGSTLIASEQDFGGENAPVVIALADGREIALTGSIDRVDRARDGSLVVTDHKTGGRHKYRGLSDDDPTVGGTLFQLPAYAAAAQVLFGPKDGVVHAEYGLMGKGDYARPGLTLTPEVWELVTTQLERVVSGIESGFFPNRPERPGWRPFVACEYCEPDHLGTAERWPEWERKQHDPRIAQWFGAPAPSADVAEAAT